jgi:DNA (cytosine-5)-methyltransferase 1
LCARQNDGILSPFPIWDDVQTFDGRPWRGIVDVVSGGFPCQDISSNGKGAGIEGVKSSMWKHMARIIGEVQPRFAFVENSPMLTSRGLGTVLADLSKMGFDAEWGVLSAAQVGALHRRERIWVLASNTDCQYVEGGGQKEVYQFPGLQGIVHSGVVKNESGLRELLRSGLRREFNGLPAQVDRIAAVGNAQFPSVAATAFNLLKQRLND